MGVSIELKKLDWNIVIRKLMNKGIEDRDMLEKILLKFGERTGDWYVILNNEYYEDHNSYYNLSHMLDRYFNIVDSFDVLVNNHVLMTCNCSEYEVAEELGLEIDWKEGD